MITRRRLAIGVGTATLGGALSGCCGSLRAADSAVALVAEFRRIEVASNGRPGVAILDTSTGERTAGGIPTGWRVGDKTGSGGHGTTNDIAVVWPPSRAPLIMAVYLTETSAPAAQRNASLAAVARAVAVAATG